MISPIVGRSQAPSSSAVNYIPLAQPQVASATPTENIAAQPMSDSGTLSNFYMLLGTAPGVGTSWDFTLMKNGVATAFAINIAGAATSGSDTSTTVSYVAGDTFSIRSTPNTTPGSSGVLNFFIETSSTGQQLLTGAINSVSNAVSNYIGIMGAGGTLATTTTAVPQVIPTPGTIDKLYLAANIAPGVAKSYTATLVVNGVDTLLTASFTGNVAVSANDTTHSVSVNAGDTAYFRFDPAGSPASARVHLGVRFTPTTDGESIQLMSSVSNLASASATNFQSVGSGPLVYSSTSSARDNLLGTSYDIKKLYGIVGTAPGAAASGKKWTFNLTANGTNLSTVFDILETATSGNDTAHSTTTVANQTVGVGITGTLTPTLGTAAWGFVTYRAPIVAGSADGGQTLMIMGVG